MQIVIDIPEEVKRAFDCAKSNDLKGCYYDHGGVIGNAIKNGIPLPKGHGRLIDADRLKEEFKEHHDFYVNAYGEFKNLPTNDKSRVDEITNSIASVVNSPTIIDADKESD